MEKDLPKRKPNRLSTYDYHSGGGYFVTICTQNRKELFWDNHTNVDCARRGEPGEPALDGVQTVRFDPFAHQSGYALSTYGKIVKEEIQKINQLYTQIRVEKYVIMPNHVHLLLTVFSQENGLAGLAPTREKEYGAHNQPSIATVISSLKGHVSRRIGQPIWQKSFYDHVIRNEADFIEKWRYIDNNPLQWELDELYETSF